MTFCTQCGKQLFDNTLLCGDCASVRQKKAIPYAEPPPTQDYSQYQTTPLNNAKVTGQIQRLAGQPHPVHVSHCPFCGGSTGVFTKSTVSQAGLIYMVVMFFVSFIMLMIFFPCAIIPLGLLFLGLLMKDKYLACLDCGKRVN